MIRAVIWDMGGVLVKEEPQGPRRAWEKRLGMAKGELDRLVFHHPLTPSLSTGEKTPDDLGEILAAALELSPADGRRLMDDFWGPPEWNETVMDCVAALQGRYKLGVLSDAWISTRAKVAERINDRLFDAILFSAEEGRRKPDPHYYTLVLSRLGVEAQEAVFVDDRQVNIEGAGAVGIDAVYFSADTDLRVELAAAGVAFG
jgi:glucose-1-phosphatase